MHVLHEQYWRPQGAQPRDKVRGRKAAPPDPVAVAVHDRAYELVHAVWQAERWKSSITTKVSPYLSTLIVGRKLTPPAGVPQRIVKIVQRCVAQACLECQATGLNVQTAPWYQEAVAAAQREVRSS